MDPDQQLQDQILQEIKAERKRQDEKFGVRNDYPPERWIVILAEEFGEVSNALLEHDFENYRAEFIQVAAVAVAALECYMRKVSEDYGKQ